MSLSRLSVIQFFAIYQKSKSPRASGCYNSTNKLAYSGSFEPKYKSLWPSEVEIRFLYLAPNRITCKKGRCPVLTWKFNQIKNHWYLGSQWYKWGLFRYHHIDYLKKVVFWPNVVRSSPPGKFLKIWTILDIRNGTWRQKSYKIKPWRTYKNSE